MATGLKLERATETPEPEPTSHWFAEDFTSLKWVYREHRDGETATFMVSGLKAVVIDCDGDASEWFIKDTRTRAMVAEGGSEAWNPPHFFRCLGEAEVALRAEVDRRKIALRKH